MDDPIQRSYLNRPRIDRLFGTAVEKPVVTVVAGAGYGKTSAVSSYLQRQRLVRLVWLDFTERDNTGECFWENFTAAVRVLNKDSARSLEEIGFPSTDRRFDRCLRIPLAGVNRQFKYIFVYDDFHLVHNTAVLRFMEKFITLSLFPNITSMLISRTEIPLNLMGLDAKGLLAKVNQEDLVFSMEELRGYFSMREIYPTELKIKNVYRLSEGWPFAVRLSAEILLREQALDWSLGNCGPDIFKTNIFKLIEQEIISGAAPGLRKFLITISLLNVYQAKLLEEIGGPEMMEELRRIGTFISLDVYADMYHIHPLLRDYLRSLENELSPAEKQKVYSLAASWCFAKGQKLNALEYYGKAADYQGIYKVMNSLPFIVGDGEGQALLDLMSRFPPEVYETCPELHGFRIRYLVSLGRFEEAEKQCAEIIGVLENREDCMTDFCAAQALAGLYNTSVLMKDIRSQATGDYSFAEDAEKACRYQAVSGFVPPLPVTVYMLCSYVCKAGGSGEEEREKFLSALARSEFSIGRSMGGCAAGLEDLARAETAFFKNDLARAEELSYRAVKKAKETFQYEIENRALFFLLRIAFFTGSTGTVKMVLAELEDQLTKGQFVNRFIYYDIVIGWFKIQIGESAEIAPWLKNSFEESDLNSMIHGQESLIKARYHLASREYPQALASLQSRGGEFGLRAFLFGRVESGALEAVCRYRDGDREESFAVFKRTCLEAMEDNLFMPFAELGRDMRTLTAAVLEDPLFFKDEKLKRNLVSRLNTAASIYAKRLILVKKEFRKQNEIPIPEELSPREWKTLACLYQGLTGEEIAQETYLSINTVKSVTKRLYGKLGASNKADAIRIALEAGLLGPPQDRSAVKNEAPREKPRPLLLKREPQG